MTPLGQLQFNELSPGAIERGFFLGCNQLAVSFLFDLIDPWENNRCLVLIAVPVRSYRLYVADPLLNGPPIDSGYFVELVDRGEHPMYNPLRRKFEGNPLKNSAFGPNLERGCGGASYMANSYKTRALDVTRYRMAGLREDP